MNYFKEIMDRLVAACSDSEVAGVTSVTPVLWASDHIFDGGVPFIAGQNRGRVPFVVITRKNSSYDFQAVTVDISGQADQGGFVTSEWEIKVVVGVSSNSNMRTNEESAYLIMQKCLKKIRKDYNLAIGNEQVTEVITHPFGLQLNCNLTIQNTYAINSH